MGCICFLAQEIKLIYPPTYAQKAHQELGLSFYSTVFAKGVVHQTQNGMKNLLSLLSTLFITSLLLTSCEFEDAADVNQDRIFTRYELFYDANEDITYAKTTLFLGNEGGTQLQSDKATITFNGEALDWNNLLAFYEAKLPGYISSGEFEYKDLDDNVFKNEVTIVPIDFPDDQSITLNRDQSYTINWEGTALTEGELVSAVVIPNAVQETKPFLEINKGADAIVLGAGQFKDINPGPGVITLDRVHGMEMQEAPSAGGKLEGHYRAKNHEITIE